MKLSPALAYLASSPWAMEFGLFGRLADVVAAHAAGERIDAETVAAIKAASGADAAPMEPGVQWIGRTAVVPVRGAVARYASSVNGFCQPQGRSAEAIQSDLMAAAERGAERIILRMDSPGGEVAGTAETAAMVRHISAGGIPVIAFVDGLAASAAYWIASQADEIVASSDTAQVGSIGIATTISGGAGRHTVITSAPGKAGQPLNDAHLANARSIVADLATSFADAVAAGRGMSAEQVAAIATGEVWTAQRALELKLVDRIATWDQVIGNADAESDPVAVERRKAIAARIAATITVSQPAARAAANIEPTQTAAADQAQAPTSKDHTVDPKLMATLAALCQTHTTLAAALVAEANKPGATPEVLNAFAAAAASKAKEDARTAEVADLKAKAEAATAEAADLKAKLATAESDKAKAEAALAKIKAHAPGHRDPGGDDQSDTPAPTSRAKMTADEKGAYIEKHGADAYAKLPA